ncbi:unnamed protein product, partial [Nesidiocoris tenuis]
MAGEVVVDALPYIDQGYDEPGVREGVKNCSSFSDFTLLRFRTRRPWTTFVVTLWKHRTTAKCRCVTHPVFRRKRRLAMEKFADKKMQLLQIKEQILNEQLAAAIAYKNSQLIQLRIKEVELAAVECKCTCRAEVERARSAP